MSLSKEIIELISKVSGCLHLANLGLDDEDVLELAKILEKRPDITSLDLRANMFTHIGASAIFRLSHVIKLDISNNNLGDIVVTEFISFLRDAKDLCLTTLDLNKSGLTDESVRALLQAKQNDVIAKKMAKIHICLDSNRSISSELLDQFYGRPTCLPEERFASLALNRTSDLSPYHPIFSRIQQSSTTEEADELSEKAADVCEKIRAIQAVYNSLPEEERSGFSQIVITKLGKLGNVSSILNSLASILPPHSPPSSPRVSPPIPIKS